ncbi:YtxH domain-containing protein [Gracilimonas sp.]|uniref:YtxH domain-containing protein n=1 Tax=Gracilimonas sp. TaxID=1974203 RepID=UPI0032EEC992
MKRVIGTLLVGATAFAGGVISALLFSPKSGEVNRRWVSKQSKKTKGLLEEKGKKWKEDSEKRIDRFSKGVKKTLKDSVPNLYEATENLHFSEEEEVEEITKHG